MDRERKGGAAMRELIIGKNDAGARLDRFVSKALPLLPQPRPLGHAQRKRADLHA